MRNTKLYDRNDDKFCLPSLTPIKKQNFLFNSIYYYKNNISQFYAISYPGLLAAVMGLLAAVIGLLAAVIGLLLVPLGLSASSPEFKNIA